MFSADADRQTEKKENYFPEFCSQVATIKRENTASVQSDQQWKPAVVTRSRYPQMWMWTENTTAMLVSMEGRGNLQFVDQLQNRGQ